MSDSDDSSFAVGEVLPDATPADELIVLDTIWEDDMIERHTGLDTWNCKWCKKTFKGINATKALAHVLRISGKSISGCKAFRKIDEGHKLTYEDLRKRQNRRGSYSAKAKEVINERMDEQGRLSSQLLIKSSGKKAKRPAPAKSSGSGDEPDLKQAKLHQTYFGNTVDKTAEKTMTMAIADMIHACGLPFALASNRRFRKVLTLAKTVPKDYKPPSRTQVAGKFLVYCCLFLCLSNWICCCTTGKLLDINYQSYMNTIMETLKKDAKIFGISVYGDGATIKRMPLINLLAAGVHNPSAVLDIADCTKRMAEGKKKDGDYIAKLFVPHVEKLEITLGGGVVDLAFFDGASNMQKAGEILEAKYPRMSVIQGAEHVISLFFKSIFAVSWLIVVSCLVSHQHLTFCRLTFWKLPEFKVLMLFNRQLYKCFGSGAMHKPYALFQKQSRHHNNGRSVGFLRASDTRMGGHVIATMRALRLKIPLFATLGQEEFKKDRGKVSTNGEFVLQLCRFLFYSTLTYLFFILVHRLVCDTRSCLKRRSCGRRCRS